VCKIFMYSRDINIFTKFNMAAVRHLDLFEEVVGPTTKAHSWWLSHVKMLS